MKFVIPLRRMSLLVEVQLSFLMQGKTIGEMQINFSKKYPLKDKRK